MEWKLRSGEKSTTQLPWLTKYSSYYSALATIQTRIQVWLLDGQLAVADVAHLYVSQVILLEGDMWRRYTVAGAECGALFTDQTLIILCLSVRVQEVGVHWRDISH